MNSQEIQYKIDIQEIQQCIEIRKTRIAANIKEQKELHRALREKQRTEDKSFGDVMQEGAPMLQLLNDEEHALHVQIAELTKLLE